MIGSPELKSAHAARNSLPLQRNALHGSRGSSQGKTNETQLLNFPYREVFRPAPQPAVGAVPASPQRYAASVANDQTGRKRRGRYNWDGRLIGEPGDGHDSPPVARRVLLPVGGLALLAGVALGAFYFMHTFASDQGSSSVVAAADTHAPASAATQPSPQAAAAPRQVAAKAADDQGASTRVASPAKMADAGAKAVAVAGMKVPAPDNARWGAETKGGADPAPAGQADDPKAAPPAQADAPKAALADIAADKATAPSDVKDPQTAPVPAEAPKKLAYASPELKAPHAVDKRVTASLPPAKQDTTPPGVDPNLLSIPSSTAAKPAAAAADEGVSGGYNSVVNSGVRMHSGAGNHTGTVGVIPSKATVRVLSCNGWCRVSYNGKQGYIFKSFLGGSAAVAQPAPAAAQAAPPPEPEAQKKTAEAAASSSTAALEQAGEHTLTTRAR
ncbi:MAG: SH3 domain-containing protein [Rhizobiaceae bacterium]